MRKLFLLAIPLFLFAFTIPGDTLKKEKPANQQKVVANSLCVLSCTSTHIRVSITGSPLPVGSTTYWHVDGLLFAEGRTFINVPRTAINVYVTVGTSYPGTMLTGDTVAALASLCGSGCP